MSDFIPLSVPHFPGNELTYVTETIKTEWVSSVGSYVDRFEKEFAEYVGVKYAVATVNGTAALHVSLLLCGVKPGDEVLVPNLTFVATVNAVRYCFANPVFMDSEWSTLGMDPQKVKDFLEQETRSENGELFNKKTGARIKAIVPMHTFGHPVLMDEINTIAEKYDLPVIEDATESVGSDYKGKKTGSLSTIACFSFNGNKIITCGGGGMITTNDEALAKRAKHLTTTAKTDPVFFEHDEVGFNYRMVNILAALGVAQLENITQFVQIKREGFKLYNELITNERVSLIVETNEVKSNYWMYALRLLKGQDLRATIQLFQDNQVQVRPIWQLMDKLPMFALFQSYRCDKSVEMAESIVNIPCSTNLTNEQIKKVASLINTI